MSQHVINITASLQTFKTEISMHLLPIK